MCLTLVLCLEGTLRSLRASSIKMQKIHLDAFMLRLSSNHLLDFITGVRDFLNFFFLEVSNE